MNRLGQQEDHEMWAVDPWTEEPVNWFHVVTAIVALIALVGAVTYGLWTSHDEHKFREECLKQKGFATRTEDGRRICARLL